MYGLRIYGNQNYVDNSVLDDLFEKSNFVNHEPFQEFHRMERLWRMYCYRRQARDCNQQNSPVFYICFDSNIGFADYYLPGAGFLAEYEKIYLGSEEESLVLFVSNVKLCRIILKKEFFIQVLRTPLGI